jgi:glutathione S-transferase
MTKPILTYFEIRGRAEPARLMLEDCGVDYENRFIPLEEWPKVKGDFKFGQLPVYHNGEQAIEESLAIYNHIARQNNLLPTKESELIRHDQVQSLILTSALELGLLFWDGEFEAKRGDMLANKLPLRLENLERFFAESRGPFWLGDKISYADFTVWCYLDTVRLFDDKILANFPKLSGFKTTMEKRPKINAYLRSDRRPKKYTVAMATFGGHDDLWKPEAV